MLNKHANNIPESITCCLWNERRTFALRYHNISVFMC